MIRRSQSRFLLRNRKARHERMLRKMSAMRSAKARKRLENPPEHEPKMQRWFPLELGLRDRQSGEIAWVPFVSIRDAARRLHPISHLRSPISAPMTPAQKKLYWRAWGETWRALREQDDTLLSSDKSWNSRSARSMAKACCEA
jgi:hypothetical protein